MIKLNRRLRGWARLLPVVTLVLGATLAWTSRTTLARPPVPAGVDPKADEVLRRAGQTLASAKAFSFEVNETIDQTLENGQKVQFDKSVKALVRRPNAIAAEITGDLEELRYAYMGTRMMLLNKREHAYAQAEVPDNIDAMFDFINAKFGLTAPLSDLMFADPYQTLIARVRTGAYLGLHQVNGVKCHHLAFRQEGIDWQVWLEDNEKALPRKVVITYKEQPGYPQFVAVLDKWDLSPAAPDSAFTFDPPADAKRVDLVPVDAPADGATAPAPPAPSNPAAPKR